MSKNRVKIACNEYKIGDKINEKRIISFGKAWTEKVADNSHFCGQLWEECGCGEEPVYLPHHRCKSCIDKRHGVSKLVCYAYLEE